jgi:hypothetical protein
MTNTTDPRATDELDDTQRAILDFEQTWWKYAGAKETAVRAAFGCSSTAYYQRLNHIIDIPAALAYDALLVRRLRRLRDARRDVRTAR